jgi:hypothetical protein
MELRLQLFHPRQVTLNQLPLVMVLRLQLPAVVLRLLQPQSQSKAEYSHSVIGANLSLVFLYTSLPSVARAKARKVVVLEELRYVVQSLLRNVDPYL